MWVASSVYKNPKIIVKLKCMLIKCYNYTKTQNEIKIKSVHTQRLQTFSLPPVKFSR